MKMISFVISLIALCALLGFLPASASDFTLHIFGNANMDDTIDEQDIEFVQGIIDRTKDETELADANCDGVIDEGDIDQIEMIIRGEETELIYVDCDGETVSVSKPVDRIVVAYNNNAEMIRVVKATGRVVGVCDDIIARPRYFPELSQIPSVGNRLDMDIEAILELKPDIVFTGTRSWYTPELEENLKGTDIDVVRLPSWEYNRVREGVLQLGYILNEKENALEWCEWHDIHINIVQDRVRGIPDKTRVFVDRPGGTSVGPGSGYAEVVEMAGGINLAGSLGNFVYPEVEREWVLEQNPEVIIGISFNGSYETDESSVLEARYNEIVDSPGFGLIDAEKNNRVYITHYIIQLGPSYPVGLLYLAKWIYPDLFVDLDPQEIHQEFIDRFQGIDFDVSEHGAFVYPPL